MTVLDAVRTVIVPQQPPPVDPLASVEPRHQATAAPSPVPARAPQRLLGRDRPLLAEEREFAMGLIAMCLALSTIIVVGIALASWSAN